MALSGTTNLSSLELGGNLTVTGTETITGAVTYSGNVTLGDAATDVIKVISDSLDDTNGNELVEFTATASAVNHLGVVNSATGNNPILRAEGEANTGVTIDNSEGEEIIILDSVATSVNEVTVSSAATGGAPKLAATGDDTNIDLALAAKGTGGVQLVGDESLLDSNGNELVSFSATASAINEVTLTNAALGNAPKLAATGDDTDINLALSAKGTGGIQLVGDEALLDSNGNQFFRVVATASAVNELTATNAATANAPQLSATGDDTNIDLGLAAKGTGNVVVQTGGLSNGAISNSVYPVYPTAAQENITAGTGGAVSVTTYLTTIETDAGGDAYTLADGSVVGQIKRIQMITDGGGDGTLTPTNLSGGTTITFADVGDYAELVWTPGGWVAIVLSNEADGVTAPVLA